MDFTQQTIFTVEEQRDKNFAPVIAQPRVKMVEGVGRAGIAGAGLHSVRRKALSQLKYRLNFSGARRADTGELAEFGSACMAQFAQIAKTVNQITRLIKGGLAAARVTTAQHQSQQFGGAQMCGPMLQ